VYNNIDVAIKFLYVLIALNILFAVLVYAMKIKKLGRNRTESRFETKIKDYLTYVLANIEEELNIPPYSLNKVEQAVMQERLNDMIENFTGAPREKCIALCKQLGLVQYHLKRLEKGSYAMKIDAAYHLGCMRVQEAVPALLELLQAQKLNSSLFIIARAIAKCARDARDVKEMVQIMLRHNKGFYDLLVDMIKEADIDHGAVFGEFIGRGSNELIHIGLCGLKDYAEPTVASAVYRLIDSPDKVIQRKAVEIYLQSVHFIPRNVVQKLLQHGVDDVRVLTIQAIADLKLDTYIDVMRETLMDDSKRVAAASVKGLLLLGEEGIAELCEVIAEVRGADKGEYLHVLVEEELEQLSKQLQDLNKLTRYNSLIYHYEKTLGNNRPIIRVV